MLIYLTAAALVAAPLGDATDEWSIEYNTYIQGPRTVYEGTARLYATEDSKFPCLQYCFTLPEGRLSGLLPFDWWQTKEDTMEIVWCRTQLPLHPFTGEDLQSYPIEIPRHFKFYIIKTEFNADDLSELLSDWGPPKLIDAPWPQQDYMLVSPWDLNDDTVVDGKDLTILLAGWKID